MKQSEIDTQLIDKLFHFSRIIREQMQNHSLVAHLTFLQLESLIILKKHKVVQMSDVADNFRISMPTATVLLDKLVLMKLVKRIHDPKDRRVVKVTLTDRGEMLMTEELKRKNEKLNKFLDLLTEKEKTQILGILSRVVENTA